jgi:MFS family permease
MIWSRNYILLLLSNFFLFFGAEMLTPVLPVYMVQNGGTNTRVGIVMGSFTLSAIIIRLLSVKATQLLGERLFLILGLIVCALAAFGYYLTAALSFILLLRIFHGFGFGSSTTMYSAIVSNIVPESRLGQAMGIFGLGTAISIAIGPFIGAMAVTRPGYKYIFFVSSGLIILSIILTEASTAGIETDKIKKTVVRRISLSDFLEVKALVPSILGCIYGISMAGMFTFISLFGIEINIRNIGLFFLITSLAEFIIRPLSGKLYDKRGHFSVLVPGAITSLIGTILLAKTTGISMLVTASIFYGIGVGMLFPVLEAWSLKTVASDRRVAASATFYNFLDIGVGVGSVVLGIVAQATNYATMYLYSSVVFVIFLAVYIPYCLKYGKRE